MTLLRNRPYAGDADLPALFALWPACRPAAWQADFPSPTDLAELLAAEHVARRTRVWMDARDRTCAYALLDDYGNLWFDRAPQVTDDEADDLVARGIACARKERPADQPGEPATLDTACRTEDHARIALLRRHGFTEQTARTLCSNDLTSGMTQSPPVCRMPTDCASLSSCSCLLAPT